MVAAIIVWWTGRDPGPQAEGMTARPALPSADSTGAAARAVPVLFVLGSCISLQFGAALATQLFPALGSWGTTTLRLGLAAVVLLAIVRPRVSRLDRTRWLAILAFGGAIGLMNGSFYAAIERIPLGTAVAIEFLGPLVVAAVLSTRRSDLLWVVLALAGVGLFGVEEALGAADLDRLGVLFALVAAVFWGLYIITSARVGRLVPGQDGLALAMTVGALVVLPLGAPGAVLGITDPRLLALALGTAVLASVLPYSLELAALRRVPRHVFGILLSLEPVIALAAGVALLGQEATALRIVAALLVVGASVGVTLTARGAAEDPSRPQHLEEGAGELPIATHATATGEIAVLTEEELRQVTAAESEEPAPGGPGHDAERVSRERSALR